LRILAAELSFGEAQHNSQLCAEQLASENTLKKWSRRQETGCKPEDISRVEKVTWISFII
jgi:hypothetical protein